MLRDQLDEELADRYIDEQLQNDFHKKWYEAVKKNQRAPKLPQPRILSPKELDEVRRKAQRAYERELAKKRQQKPGIIDTRNFRHTF